ncbi:MAG: collagen binding domain-containing protein [Parahaliea sp.]
MQTTKKLSLLFIVALISTRICAAPVNVVDTITVNPTTVTNYDDVTVNINWSRRGVINIGDSFSVDLPSQIQTVDNSTVMYSAGNLPVGVCDLVGSTITCTFSVANANNGIVTLEHEFYDQTVTTTSTVPIAFEVNSSAFSTVDMVVSPRGRDADELLMKTGVASTGSLEPGDTIAWYARANCRGDTINNFVFSDTVATGHELDVNDVWIEEGNCNGVNGDFVAERVIPVPGSAVTITPASTSNGGSISLSLASTDKAYVMVYRTTVTMVVDNYTNDALVSGDGSTIEQTTQRVARSHLSATGNSSTQAVPVFHPLILLISIVLMAAMSLCGRMLLTDK